MGMLPPCALFLLTAFAINRARGASSEEESVIEKKFKKLVSWIVGNGGRVDDRLGLTNHQHGNRFIRGGVALENMEAGSELLFLPWKLVLDTVGDTADVPENSCDALRYYAGEVEAGYASL